MSETTTQKRNRVNEITADLFRFIHVQSTDKKFYEASIKALVRRLLRDTDNGEQYIESLYDAVTAQNSCSGCITIPRSLDGRMQILNRKVIPHFHFVKIFCLPEIKSYHQLAPVDHCYYPYHSGKSMIYILHTKLN
jgi:MAD (mothers against decapentaplegic) family protein 1